MMVKKASRKWQICIDFTDLNKACPKDSFPLPKIDRLIDATTGYKLLSFMDTFSRYNQICMAPKMKNTPPSSLNMACTTTESCRSG